MKRSLPRAKRSAKCTKLSSQQLSSQRPDFFRICDQPPAPLRVFNPAETGHPPSRPDRLLDGSEIERHLEIPAWMFDRAACAGDGHFVLDPFVSLEALNALSILLNQLLKTVVPSLNVQYPGACGNSQEKNQGVTHDREYEDAADRKASQDGH